MMASPTATNIASETEHGFELTPRPGHGGMDTSEAVEASPQTIPSSHPPDAPITESVTQEETNYPKGSQLAFIFITVLLTSAMIGLDAGVISTAIPSITDHFRTISDIGWYYSAYQLSICSLQFLFGNMYTLFPMKVVFITSILLFEAGSILCATASSSTMLVLGRGLAGVGGSGTLAGGFVTIRESVPLQKRSIFGGTFGGIELLFMLVGPILGGLITQHWSWRGNFYINLPLGGFAVFAALKFFPKTTLGENSALPLMMKFKRLDPVGTMLFIPGVVALLLALQWAGINYGWANARIITLFAVFLVTLTAFILLQKRKGDAALIPPAVIRNRSILAGMWFSASTNAAMGVVTYYVPIYAQSVKQQSAAKSGLMLLPLVGGSLITCLLSGWATSKIGFYTPFMLATSVTAPIAAGLLTTLQTDTSVQKLLGLLALLGIGAGTGIQAPQIAAQTVLSKEDAATGIAAIIFAQNFGPTLFVSVAHTIFAQRLTADLAGIPSLNETSVQTTGLASLSNQLGQANLERALFGYDKAVAQTFYLPLALTCATLLGSLAMEWKSVKPKTS